jgi:hypothetical protein
VREARCTRKSRRVYKEDCSTSYEDLCTTLTVIKFVEDCANNIVNDNANDSILNDSSLHSNSVSSDSQPSGSSIF